MVKDWKNLQALVLAHDAVSAKPWGATLSLVGRMIGLIVLQAPLKKPRSCASSEENGIASEHTCGGGSMYELGTDEEMI